jgi:thioredoxin-related protein
VPVKSNAGRSRLYESYIKTLPFYVPNTVFTDASGKEIDRIVGYLAPVDFQQRMDSILGDRVT